MMILATGRRKRSRRVNRTGNIICGSFYMGPALRLAVT